MTLILRKRSSRVAGVGLVCALRRADVGGLVRTVLLMGDCGNMRAALQAWLNGQWKRLGAGVRQHDYPRSRPRKRRAFLSAFFTLVGSHGLHVTIGLIWLSVMMVQVATRGFSRHRRAPLAMFFTALAKTNVCNTRV